MNYTFTKQYGKIVRKMAAEFNKGRDIFEAASALDKYAKYNFAYSRYAYRELYGRFYPDNQKAVTFVIDRYVMSNEVATAFLENLYVDQDEEIEFIKREIGDVYSLLRQIQKTGFAADGCQSRGARSGAVHGRSGQCADFQKHRRNIS